MKLILPIALFVCVYNTSLFSQTIIPKLGISVSTVTFSDESVTPFYHRPFDYKSQIGFLIGVGFKLPVSKKFSIQPELVFQQKGFKAQSNYSGDVTTSNFTFNYLELPLLFKLNIKNFYLNAGPSLAIGVGGKYRVCDSYNNGFRSEQNGRVIFGKHPDNYIDDNFYIDNKSDIGLQFGGGLIVAGIFSLDLRYGLGLSGLWDEDSVMTDNKSKNRCFQFNIGFPIKLKK